MFGMQLMTPDGCATTWWADRLVVYCVTCRHDKAAGALYDAPAALLWFMVIRVELI